MRPVTIRPDGVICWTIPGQIYAECVSPNRDRSAWDVSAVFRLVTEWVSWGGHVRAAEAA